MRITAKALAKINLLLSVTGKRGDGYHLLESVMQSVNLYDTVTVSDTNKPGEITVTLSGLKIPPGGENTAKTAAEKFFEYTGIPNPGILIHIKKRIPAAAGMGGGSADAAAVITILGAMSGEDTELPELLKIAEAVGADVPFCLIGGTALAEGTGEILTPLPTVSGCRFVIAKAGEKQSTAEMYRRLDEAGPADFPDCRDFVDTVCLSEIPLIGQLLFNSFSGLCETELSSRVREIMASFAPLGISLSGSGPSWFAIFDEKQAAEKCAGELRKICSEVFVCEPAESGVVLEG